MTRSRDRRAMPRRSIILCALLAAVSVALGGVPASAAMRHSQDGSPAWADTPEPTPPGPDRTARPGTTASPSPEPEASPEPIFPQPPARTSLLVAVRAMDASSAAPLILARERGFFAEAGFEQVELVAIEEALPALVGGQVDIGVVESIVAASGFSQGLSVQALAGYRNLSGGGATYGGDLLLSGAELVATEPTTVTAFLGAYLRALRDLADPAQSEDIRALLEAAGMAIEPAAYEALRADYAPHDGGFGTLEQGAGLGQLRDWLAETTPDAPELASFLAWPALNVTQMGLGLPPNPAVGLLGSASGMGEAP